MTWPWSGEILLAGPPVPAGPGRRAAAGVAVVWQDLALCDNLDIAANVLLGRERRRLLFSEQRVHAAAAAACWRPRHSAAGHHPQRPAPCPAASASWWPWRGRCAAKPRLLPLDEPTASLGVQESAQVEGLITSLREQGTTILLACHDIDQMFRLADRIVVLRHGRVVADLDPRAATPDEVVALLSGQPVDSSARRQLTRLHGLADRLVSADPSSSLSLILSALGAALGTERLCIHLLERPDPWSAPRHSGSRRPAGRLVAAAGSARRAARSGSPRPPPRCR